MGRARCTTLNARLLQAPDALLGWQVAFVEELHGAGVVDDVERKSLLAPDDW